MKSSDVSALGRLAKSCSRFLPVTYFLSNVFNATQSKYQREQFAKDHLPYVKPESQQLSSTASFQYVPILSVLRNMILCDTFRNHLESQPSHEQFSYLQSFRDGKLYKEKLSQVLVHGSQYTLFLLMYTDELEVVNPLGAK